MTPPIIESHADELDLMPRPDRAQAQTLTPVGRRELSGRLAGLSLYQQVLVLAVWPLLEQILNFMVGYVDTALAGRLSNEALNAVGAAAYFNWLISLVQGSIGVGATAIIARAVGGRHKRVANAALGQAMILGLLGGLAVGAMLYVAAPWIAWLLHLDGLNFTYFVQYLRIMSAAAPFSGLLFVGTSCLRGAGDTKTPFFVLIVVNVVNTAASTTLVAAPSPWGGHGVVGIALGTLLAWVVGAALMLVALIGGWGGIRLRIIRLRPHWHAMLRVLRVAVPSLGEMFLSMWLANFFVLMIVGRLGDKVAMGANLVAIRSEGISFMPGFAMGIAAMTLTGQYLGLGDPERARRATILCWRLGAAIMGVMGLLFILIPYPFVRILTDKPELIATSMHVLRIAGFVQIFFGTAIILRAALQGAGDTRMTLVLSGVSMYLVRIPLAAFCGLVMGWGLVGVWVGLCGELIIRGSLFAARFFHGGWAKIKV